MFWVYIWKLVYVFLAIFMCSAKFFYSWFWDRVSLERQFYHFQHYLLSCCVESLYNVKKINCFDSDCRTKHAYVVFSDTEAATAAVDRFAEYPVKIADRELIVRHYTEPPHHVPNGIIIIIIIKIIIIISIPKTRSLYSVSIRSK